MSAISNFLTFLRSAIYAIDVRDGIADAIEQCYNDVNNPTLKTEALEAALQNKIDEGEMAALTIGDHTITAAKLAQGVIDNTLATSGAAADAAETGRQMGSLRADLDDSLNNVVRFDVTQDKTEEEKARARENISAEKTQSVPEKNLVNAISNAVGIGYPVNNTDSNVYFEDSEGTIGIILRDGFDSKNACSVEHYYNPNFPNGAIIDEEGNVFTLLSHAENRLFNKKICAIGDSYVAKVAGNTSDWLTLLAEHNHMSQVNLGYGGRSLRKMVQNEDYIAIPADSDYIIVFTGHNDILYDPTPIGEPNDLSNTTFYGCLNILCRWIMNNRPLARTLFITPTHGASSGDALPFANAMLETCRNYGISCWDSYGNLGMLISGKEGVDQRAIFESSTDGNYNMHLNDLAQMYLYPKIEQQLKML